MTQKIRNILTHVEDVVSEDGELLDRTVKGHKYMAGSREEFLMIYASLLSAFISMSQAQIRVYGYLLRYADGAKFAVNKSLRIQMQEEIDINERTIYNTLTELEDKTLIFKHNGIYQINPRFAFRGSTKDRDGALMAIVELGCKNCI